MHPELDTHGPNTPENDTEVKRTLDQLFRRETGRLVASLVRRLGAHHLTLAEDIAQEALLAAARTWPYDGMPDNPAAWLNRVATNRAIDLIRRQKTASEAALVNTERGSLITETLGPEDNQLRLLMLCCHGDVPEMDRLTLTLNICFGFSAREVARLFLKEPSAISARLTRAKTKLQINAPDFAWPTPMELDTRITSVLKVIYLAFSLGYSPREGALAVRQDTALEALHMVELLASETSARGDVCALAALLCLQASRLGSRTDDEGRFVLLKAQDRKMWDQALISRGFHYLAQARASDVLSRYHIEAGIAALHASAPSFGETDWNGICGLYETLEAVTDSPVAALNHAVALSAAGQPDAALLKITKLECLETFTHDIYFHTAKAEVLLMNGDKISAKAAFIQAQNCIGTSTDITHLEHRLSECF
ncbi:RNA polymerase sigma factor [Kordiimonas sp.]|uniref:RNA polymerase sigma factor n=1 Tax=Kordiimonas sp. TaxID=1970157 RepID=UPI003B516CF1